MSQSYHRIIRKVVIAFGNIFNNISLSRYDSNGEEKEHFLVPIVYGGKEKYVSRLEGDPNLDKKVQVSLPIMSFEMTDMKYDASRKLATNMKNAAPGPTGANALAVYNPVPFDFEFSLYAYVRNIEDGAQLMEKILPYFTPDYTVSVNMIPEMGLIKQLPIVLKDVSHEIDYEGDYNTKVRSIIWTLTFTVKGYLYGPVTQPKLIRTSFTNIIDDRKLHDKIVVLNMSPGGLGNYRIGEKIYQGYSPDTATATARVQYWDSINNKLEITGSTGHFVAGQPVVGTNDNAHWTIDSFDFINETLAKVVVRPNPRDVVLPNNYTYSVIVSEFPFVESANVVSFDDTSINFSNTHVTMDVA